MKKCFLLAALSISLVGCGSGVSSSKEEAEMSGTAEYSIIQRTKDFFASKSRRVAIEMPISALIVEANKDWLKEKGIHFQHNAVFFENNCHFSGGLRKSNAGFLKKLSEEELNHYTSLSEYMRRQVLYYERFYEGKGNLSADEKKFVASAKNIISVKNDDAICARLNIVTAAYPWSGWTNVDNTDFAASLYDSALISNGIHTEVVAELGDKTLWKSDAKIKNEITEIIDRMVRDGRYTNLAYNAFNSARNNSTYVLNFGNQQAAPVHFSVDDYDVQGNSNGVSLIKSGTQWFGNGFISSKKYLVNVETVEAASMKKTKTLSNESMERGVESEGNSVSVGN